MTLRTKTLLIIGLTLFCLLSLMYLINREIILGGLRRVEEKLMAENVARARASISRTGDPLKTLATDYSNWDDAVRYVEHDDPRYDADFIKSNFDNATFLQSKFDFVIIHNGSAIKHADRYDTDAADEATPPAALIEAATSESDLSSLYNKDLPGRDGLLQLDNDIYFVSSRPIRTSDGSEETYGTLILGRRLVNSGHPYLEGVDVSLQPLTGLSPDGDEAPIAETLKTDPSPEIRVIDDQLVGYGLERDLFGNALILVRAIDDRDLWNQGSQSFAVFVASLIAGCLIIGGMTIMLLERTILRRISLLDTELRRIGRAGDPSLRLDVEGRDEITRLATRVNDTFAALERSRGALQYIGKHARCILWSATATRRPDGSFELDQKMQDESVAQRVLPLDVFREGSYAHAWQRNVHPDDAERWEAAPTEAISRGDATYRQEFRVRGKDQTEHWILEEVDVEPINDTKWRLVGVCTDLTAHKQAAAELARARDAALDVSRMKSDFLANMSHEIRTPMNGIVGMTELLRHTKLDDEQHEYLALIGSSADALLRVINDVLDFSKLESGNLALHNEAFDVRASFGDTLALLAVRAQRKGLELVCDIEPSVPRTVVGDPVRIRQILVNLVGNAVKFTESGEVNVRVAAETEDDSQLYLSVEVSDTGIGIPANKQKSIFRAFAQADSSTTRKYGGTGLGLAISSQLAQQMHGRLWVESNPGQGSTFCFTALVQRTPDDARNVERTDLAGRRMLVIDEHAGVRRAIAQLARELGMMAETVVPTAAESLLSPGSVDVVVMSAQDGGLARLAGWRSTGAWEGPVVLALTAVERSEQMARCRELRARTVLKPVREDELAAAVAASLGLSASGSAPTDPTDTAPAVRPLRILLAEDQEVNRTVAIALIEREGHSVDVADNGVAALERWETGSFDVILMDIQMPEMSGIEATSAIRKREADEGRPRTPIIAMTAHALQGDRERCIRAGMDGYVPKPIRTDDLAIELARVLETGAPLPPAAPIATAPGTFDRTEALERLGGDESLLREVAALFLASAPRLLADARTARAAGDFPAMARVAHALKGSVSNLGSAPVEAAARTLEDAAEAEDAAAAATAVDRLDAELNDLLTALAPFAEGA